MIHQQESYFGLSYGETGVPPGQFVQLDFIKDAPKPFVMTYRVTLKHDRSWPPRTKRVVLAPQELDTVPQGLKLLAKVETPLLSGWLYG